MTPTSFAKLLPRPLRRQLIHFECLIEDALHRFAGRLPDRARVLDAGAGEGQYASYFQRHRYFGVDLGIGDTKWNYAQLDALADLTLLPFRDAVFDAAVNIVTLEHLKDPALALREISRVLRSGGLLLLVVPHEWEVHQSPHDFFRYTRHGLDHLLSQAEFIDLQIAPAGGYFRLMSRRFLNGIQFFQGGRRWAMFPFAAALLGVCALIAPCFESLDKDKNFTVGYICTAVRR